MTRTWPAAIVIVGLVFAVFALVYVARSGVSAPSASPTLAASVSPTRAPSPAPTASGSQTAPSPSPVASAPASSRYGYIAITAGGFALADESGAEIHRSACGVPGRPCDQTKVAVSPDGKRVAFWTSGGSQQWELRYFEAASPGAGQAVATLPPGFEGLSLAWSSDSRGLLYAAQTVGYGGVRGGAGRGTLTGINDVTVPDAPATDVMPARTDGAFYVPIGWDRQRNVVAAVTSGEGGYVFEYAVRVGDRFTTTKGTPGQMVALRVTASQDVTRVLGIDGPANKVRIWPVDDFSKQVDVGPGAGRISGALWRTPNEVIWSVGDTLDVFIPQSDSSRTVFTASGGVQLIALRPDGSGALVATANGTLAVEVSSQATTRTSFAAGPAIVARGVLLR